KKRERNADSLFLFFLCALRALRALCGETSLLSRLDRRRLLKREPRDAHLPQLELLNLAGHRLRVFFHEHHVPRHLEMGDPAAAEFLDLAPGTLAPGFGWDPGAPLPPESSARQADALRAPPAGGRGEDLLDPPGIDFLPASNDHVL